MKPLLYITAQWGSFLPISLIRKLRSDCRGSWFNGLAKGFNSGSLAVLGMTVVVFYVFLIF